MIGDYLHDRRRGSPTRRRFPVHLLPVPAGAVAALAQGSARCWPIRPTVRIRMSVPRGYTRVPAGHRRRQYLRTRERTLRTSRALLAATASRPARFGCFGLHEWAMVYHTDAPRHDVPLRLGAAGTDAVVESPPAGVHPLRRVSLLHRRRPRTQRDGADRAGPAQP